MTPAPTPTPPPVLQALPLPAAQAAAEPGRLDARRLLHARGIRPTLLRIAVLDTLLVHDRHHADEGLAPEAVYARINAQGPLISLPTVYATLGLLVEARLAERYRGGSGATHFVLRREASPSAHLVCKRCQGVTPLRDTQLAERLQALAQARQFAVQEVDLLVRGLCEACSNAGRRS